MTTRTSVPRVEGLEVADYWDAVRAHDAAAAVEVLRGARDRGVAAHEYLDLLVVAAQRRTGELWATGAWTVAHEHAVTAVNEAAVRTLLADADAAVPTPRTVPRDRAPRRPAYLLACAEREWHALPALVLAAALRAQGTDVVPLGPDVSPGTLVARVIDDGPRAVLISAALSSSLPRLRRQVEAVRATGTPVVVGGRAFAPDGRHAAAVGANAWAAGPLDLPQVLATLPRHTGPPEPLRHPGALEAAALLIERDAVVADLLDHLQLPPPAPHARDLERRQPWEEVVSDFAPHVVDALCAALLCDDHALLVGTVDWLREVLAPRSAPLGTVERLVARLGERLREHPDAVAALRAA